MSKFDEVVEDAEPKSADGASIFGFYNIFCFKFSHELGMKNHFEVFFRGIKSVGVVVVKVEVYLPYKYIHCSKYFQ